MSNTEVINYGTVVAEDDEEECTLENLLDIAGLGKAQYFVWLVLALIAYSDMSELVVISVLIPYLRCEWGLGIWFETLLSCSVFFFYALGGLIFGSISDKCGRRITLLWSLTILLIAGVLSAMATNKWQFLMARIVVGLCIGANFPVTLVFASEVVSSLYKEWGPTIMIITANLAMAIVAILAFLFLNSVGWRWFIIIVTSPILITIVLLFLLPESPRYLVASGKQEEAKETIKKYFKWNEKEFPENTRIKVYENVERGEIKDIFIPKFKKATVLLSTMYFGNILLIFSLIIFLPLALDAGFCGASKNKTPGHECKPLSQSSLLSLFFITMAGVLGATFSTILIKRVGRRIPMKVLGVVVLLLTCTLYICISKFVTQLIFFLIKFAASAFNMIIWIIIPELYPTIIRNTATGFINFWGKSGGIIGTALVYVLYFFSPFLVVTMFVGAALLSTVAALLWTVETKDNVCQDVIDDS